MADLALRAQIIVADARSTDGTREVVAHWGAELVLQSERGYGGALLAGFAAAQAPYVVPWIRTCRTAPCSSRRSGVSATTRTS
jgi:glycosyltransferase involved in cell wall biosynthesis